MKKLLWITALAIICIGAAAIAWDVAYPSVTLRYRLTLEAAVDGQPKAGSGIVEVTYKGQPEIRLAAVVILSGATKERPLHSISENVERCSHC